MRRGRSVFGWLRVGLALLAPSLMLLCVGHCSVHAYAAAATHAAHHGHHSATHGQPSASQASSDAPLLDYELIEALTLSLLPPEGLTLMVGVGLVMFVSLVGQAPRRTYQPLVPPPRWMR